MAARRSARAPAGTDPRRRLTIAIEIGRRWAVVVPRKSIVSVERVTACPDGAVDLALETPTIVVELDAPVTVRGPFGRTKRGARLALTIDDAAGFVAATA